MKKLMLASICVFSFFNTRSMMDKEEMMADKWESKKKNLIDFLVAAKTKTIHQPAEMVEKWLDLKEQELRAGIFETIKMKNQIQDPLIRAAWNNIIKTKLRLLSEIENLPVPPEGFKKSLARKAHWLKLEARKLELIAEQLRSIADQTGIKVALVLAEMKERKAKFLMDVFRAVMTGKRLIGAAKIARGVSAIKEGIAQRLDDDSDEEVMEEESESATEIE